ncbi:hypothetical protein [Aquimarina megaterium]|uniref:hypothetical protein n=1 Tax=Aquimarina megaterium TaxID=1443666 RepID=UPI0009457120|nr:hypothetical protein [Aquimarina megaterium]
MKKLLYLLVAMSLFISCEKDSPDENSTGQNLTSITIDGISDIVNKSSSSGCSIAGPTIVTPGTLVKFDIIRDTSVGASISLHPIIGNSSDWAIRPGGNINELFIQIGPSFTCGEIRLRNGDGCNFNLVVSSPGNICGLGISDVGELNGNQADEVAFFTIPTLSSGWSITSSSFSVTYQSNNVSNFIGYQNPNGYPQILIPVYCTDRVKSVTVSVTASSGSSSVVRTRTTNFSPPVCGSGGGGIGGF